MKFTCVTDVLVVGSILGGLLFGGLSVGFTSTDKASAQMMGSSGMMGMQNMMTTQGQLVSVQQVIHMIHNTPS